MAKIVFIGAGSAVFAQKLLQDLFQFPEMQSSEIHLVDIDSERLQVSLTLATRLAKEFNAAPEFHVTTDRREALPNADYVINMIQVGSPEQIAADHTIPTRYGVRQTIGDTIGIGGIMRGLRTIPVVLDIAHDIEELCPDAMLINYSNPMVMLIWTLEQATSVRHVGLCHSVFNTALELAHILNVPAGEIDYLCAGINHMAFYLKFERNGEDLYPRLKQLAEEDQFPSFERVRAKVLQTFGYFVTESSEHFSEYTPWFIKDGRQDLIDHYRIPVSAMLSGINYKETEWNELKAAASSNDPSALDAYFDERVNNLGRMATRRLAEVEKDNPELATRLRAAMTGEKRERRSGHSGEYGTLIIHSMETGQPRVVYGNVGNSGAIQNLPDDCIVELPCLVDHNGVQPTQIGNLPPQLAALMQTNINMQRLTVEAALTRKREHIYQAAMLDPHTAAELSIDEIVAMVDELIEANSGSLPAYA